MSGFEVRRALPFLRSADTTSQCRLSCQQSNPLQTSLVGLCGPRHKRQLSHWQPVNEQLSIFRSKSKRAIKPACTRGALANGNTGFQKALQNPRTGAEIHRPTLPTKNLEAARSQVGRDFGALASVAREVRRTTGKLPGSS